MDSLPVANRVLEIGNSLKLLIQLSTNSTWSREAGNPDVSDFMLGNPQEMPLPGFVQTLQRWLVPQDKDWFAYKMNTPKAQAAIAALLRERRGLPFEADDISITNGAFGGLTSVIAAVTNPGDEVIFNLPPWFFYEPIILTYSAVPVKVKVNPQTFDLDLAAIEAAITERTRAIIINSPNNPTGRIYPPEILEGLAEILTRASQRHSRTIYLISDEAYNRIIYDGHAYPSPTSYYPNSFLVYTYGKQLLTPGQRVGYIALPPTMPNRPIIRQALFAAQAVTGYAFANALLQYAIPELENLSIDVAHLQAKRDKIVTALRDMGYDAISPEGTFYVLVRSPLPDDVAFTERLAEHKVFCLPGTIFEWPGYFRISLTANDGMIDRAMPGFAKAIESVVRP
jgi:aspartate aminotransferase